MQDESEVRLELGATSSQDRVALSDDLDDLSIQDTWSRWWER